MPLVQAFQRALRRRSARGVVIVTDVNPLSPAVHVADRAYRVPLATDPGYIDEILDHLPIGEHIGLVVPTIDDELRCSAARGALRGDAACPVAVSSPDDDARCATTSTRPAACCAARRRRRGVMAARRAAGGAGVSAVHQAALRPRRRRRLSGPQRAASSTFFLGYVADPIVQEYLDGPEFTIDMLCDFDGRPLSIVPRERVVIRAGVIDRGRTVNDPR